MENASRTPARVFHFQMGGAMKTILVSLLTLSALPAPAAAADKTEINGTWSGNWTPKGGGPDEFKVERGCEEVGTPRWKIVTSGRRRMRLVANTLCTAFQTDTNSMPNCVSSTMSTPDVTVRTYPLST